MRLYPEDIAVFFDLIPIGTKVTVVNQPYVFGWRDGELYLQAYAVMEDDSRDWDKNRKRLLANLLSPKLRQKIESHGDEHRLAAGGRPGARASRAFRCRSPAAVTGSDAVLAQSVLVKNTVPKGSNWDGQSGLLVDEATYNQMVQGRPGQATASQAPAAAPAAAHAVAH